MIKKIQLFLFELLKYITTSFGWRYLIWHFIAIALTFIFVVSGFDWIYFEHTRNTTLISFLFPAAIIGFIVPIFTPLILLVVGKVKKNAKTFRAGYVLTQTSIVALFISDTYKAFTGRLHPYLLSNGNFVDITREFQFGFLKGGVFWGWPSSHTTIAFALAVTLFFLYRKNLKIKLLALFYALYVGIGVSATIHWFSDFVAGAIIGIIIGLVISKKIQKEPI